MTQIVDPEVGLLASISSALYADYAADDLPWTGSPFAWIKTRPSRQVGAIGEKLISGYLAAKTFNIARSPDSDADRIVEGMRAEIKFSTLWANGSYKFQQLRDQNYRFAICLGVSPFDAHCWIIEKPEIFRRWQLRDGIQSQHGGADGSDTAWLTIDPKNIPYWLNDRGGTLRRAVEVLSRLTGHTPA
jgi:hypothetical protein